MSHWTRSATGDAPFGPSSQHLETGGEPLPSRSARPSSFSSSASTASKTCFPLPQQAIAQETLVSRSPRNRMPSSNTSSASTPTSPVAISPLSIRSHHYDRESLSPDSMTSRNATASPSVRSSPEPLLEYDQGPSTAAPHRHCHCIPVPVSLEPPQNDTLTPSRPRRSSRVERPLNNNTRLAALLIMFLLPLIPIVFQGNFAWVSQSTRNQTAPFTFWKHIRFFHNEHENALLPLSTVFEVSGPVPAHPSAILGGLYTELFTIEGGFASWKGALRSMPPPPTGIVTRIESCRARLDAISELQASLEGLTYALLSGTLNMLFLDTIAKIEDGRLMLRANQTLALMRIKTVFTLTEKRNHEALVILQQIDRDLRHLLPEIRGILIEVFQSFSAFTSDGNNRQWVRETLDAIDYAETELLPLISDIYLPLAQKAIYALSTINSTVTDVVSYHEALELTNGIEERDVCYFVSDNPTWWSGWFLKRERITTTYFIDNRTLDELYDVAVRSRSLDTLMQAEGDNAPNYNHVRRPRPT